MQLQQTINSVFLQLSASVENLSQADYSSSCRNLSGATIRQHVRHIIEMFLEHAMQDIRNDCKFDSGISFLSPQAAL